MDNSIEAQLPILALGMVMMAVLWVGAAIMAYWIVSGFSWLVPT